VTPPGTSARPHTAARATLAVAPATVCVLLLAAPGARAATDPGDGRPGTGISALLVPVVVVLLAGGLAILAYTRRRRRAETRTTPAGSRQQQGWADAGEAAQPLLTPLPQLDMEARRLLAETDEAIRIHTEELAVATARFGQEAAQQFIEALACAGSRLSTAIRLRRQLDTAPPGDDTTRRRMLEEIVALCTEAGQRLAAESLYRGHHRDLP
jgi:hypothetical protein